MDSNHNKSSDIAPENPLDVLYEQLRAIAQHRLANEPQGHTLAATALVHEVWLKVQHRDSVMKLDRTQFLQAAGEAMRRILVDHARAKHRLKRGGEAKNCVRFTNLSDVAELAGDRNPEEILALEEALERLQREDPESYKIVNLRFFAGLSIEETAQALGRSERTIKREWKYARAWLYRVLTSD